VEHKTEILTDNWSFLEGPRWHDGRFWVSDFYTHKVIAVTMDGKVEEIVDVAGQPSGLGWLPDGDLLVVSMKDHRVLRLHDGTLIQHADLTGVLPGHLNDMVVDSKGRAYIGSFGFDLMGGAPVRPSAVARVDVDGSVSVAAEDMLFPNGSVITPDGETLVVAESFGNRLSAFTIQADGSLTDRLDWARFGDPPSTDDVGAGLASVAVAPDGMTLDADGCVWVADAVGSRAVRVRQGGEIVDQVSADGYGVFACALGGDDGRTLVLCAAPSFAEHEAAANHRARLLTCTVDVPHAGLP
jgi:sugar lactone lactonase YvrE